MDTSLTPEQASWIEGGSIRADRAGWRHVSISGGPYDRGFQHGYYLARDLETCLRSNKFWAQWLTAQEFGFFKRKAHELYERSCLIGEEFLTEMRGIAAGARANGCDTTFEEILAWNSFVDLVYGAWPILKGQIRSWPPRPHTRRYLGHRCSAFIATGDATDDGRIVMAHTTWDAFLQAQHFNVVMDIRPTKGHRMVMQTAPGWIASMMDFTVTSAGLMVTETSIDGYVPGFDEKRPPEFFVSRRACQYASSIDEWIELMEEGNNGGYANSWLLGDHRSGEIARFEAGLDYQSLEKRSDGVLWGANIPTELRIRNLETDDPDSWSDISRSGARRVRWKKLLAEHHGKLDVSLGQKMIGDHYDEYLRKDGACSRTLCGHVDEDDALVGSAHGHPPFYPWGSVDGKVADSASAANMGFHARWGRACGEPFEARGFLDAHPQYDWLEGHLIDRPTQPWTTFTDE